MQNNNNRLAPDIDKNMAHFLSAPHLSSDIDPNSIKIEKTNLRSDTSLPNLDNNNFVQANNVNILDGPLDVATLNRAKSYEEIVYLVNRQNNELLKLLREQDQKIRDLEQRVALGNIALFNKESECKYLEELIIAERRDNFIKSAGMSYMMSEMQKIQDTQTKQAENLNNKKTDSIQSYMSHEESSGYSSEKSVPFVQIDDKTKSPEVKRFKRKVEVTTEESLIQVDDVDIEKLFNQKKTLNGIKKGFLGKFLLKWAHHHETKQTKRIEASKPKRLQREHLKLKVFDSEK